MKDLDMIYHNVKIICEEECEKQFDCENFSINIENEMIQLPPISNLIINYKLKYEVLEFTDNQKQNYYQLQASLPFSFKSSWIKTNLSPNWCNYAVQRLEAELIKRYKDLIVRDYNNRKYNGLSDCQLSKIFHAPLYEKYDSDMIVAEKWEQIQTEDISTINNITVPYKFNLSFCYFVKMLVEHNCHYCGISVEQINEIASGCKLYTKRPRGYTLEIDQIESAKGYSDSNCVASCYWCNNAKTDEFSEDEFKNIACGINISWNKRLQRIGSNSKVIFPWQNQVKCCK